MAKKMVVVDLEKEIRAVMRDMNGRHGVVGHEFSEIEAALLDRGILYNNYEMEEAIGHLIKDERIVIHMYSYRAENNPPHYRVLLRTII